MEEEQYHIYLIPGLGADKRIFKNLAIAHCEVHYLDWIPNEPGESINDYTKRFAALITHSNPIVLGMSLGGVFAVEISKIVNCKYVFLVSSFQLSSQLPWYFKLGRKMNMHKLINKKMMLNSLWLFNWLFSVKSDSEKQMLKNILQDSEEDFLIWSIEALLSWRNHTLVHNLTHIHGDSDRIIPISFVQPNIIIPNGSHFMIMNKAKKISEVVNQVLQNFFNKCI